MSLKELDESFNGNVLLFPFKATICEVEDVQPIDQYQFVLLGVDLANLRLVHDGKWARAPFPCRVARARLARLLEGDPISIKFSKDSAGKLVTALGEFEKTAGAKSQDDKFSDKAVGFFEFYEVFQALETFEHNLAAELKGHSVYFVPKKGIYDISDLIDRAEMHLPVELHTWIPKLGLSEFREAGRCLAFNLPSACGFHVARSVEALLVDYAKSFGAEVDPEKHGMGDCLTALEKIKKDGGKGVKPSPKTIRTIKDIKDFDRNPLMHPRAVLSEVEALSIFSLGHSAISAMALELRKLDGKERQEALPLEEDTSPIGNALLEFGKKVTSYESKEPSQEKGGGKKSA